MKSQDVLRAMPRRLTLVASTCAWVLLGSHALAEEDEREAAANEEAAEAEETEAAEIRVSVGEGADEGPADRPIHPTPFVPAQPTSRGQDETKGDGDHEVSPDPDRQEAVPVKWSAFNSSRIPYDQLPEHLPVYPDETPPDGYLRESQPNYALIAAGTAVLGSLWAASTITAIALDSEPQSADDPNFDDMYWPMFIPVAGPFATIATADSSGTGAAILALDGVAQAAGAAMLLYGLFDEEPVLTKKHKYYIAPMAQQSGGGLTVGGKM